MHDVIDWLELCTCPFTVTFKCSRTKYSRMAADPRKPRTLNPAKIKAHTVLIQYIQLIYTFNSYTTLLPYMYAEVYYSSALQIMQQYTHRATTSK